MKYLIIGLFSFIAISILASLDQFYENPYLIASFGATAVLVFGAPKAPFSKTKNVFFGHLISAVIGITITYLFVVLGYMDSFLWLAAGLSVSIAIVLMIVTNTTHPPGGATALTCVLCGYDSLVYIVRPIMIGVILLISIAYIATVLQDSHPSANHLK